MSPKRRLCRHCNPRKHKHTSSQLPQLQGDSDAGPAYIYSIKSISFSVSGANASTISSGECIHPKLVFQVITKFSRLCERWLISVSGRTTPEFSSYRLPVGKPTKSTAKRQQGQTEGIDPLTSPSFADSGPSVDGDDNSSNSQPVSDEIYDAKYHLLSYGTYSADAR